MDLVARIMSMGSLHKAYAVTGAVCTAGAAGIEGTVVHDMVAERSGAAHRIRIGHPGGVIITEAQMEKKGGEYEYREAVIHRTARRLMEGHVCVPQTYFSLRGDQ